MSEVDIMFGVSIFKICSAWEVKLGLLITEIVYKITGYIMAYFAPVL